MHTVAPKYSELFARLGFNYFIDLFLSVKIHSTQTGWCILVDSDSTNCSASFVCANKLGGSVLSNFRKNSFCHPVSVYQVCVCVCLNNENHSADRPNVFNYFCVFCPCVTKWKPSKPGGVISLSTWIFDWYRIKNSVKGNGRNKRRETSQDRSRQTEGGLRSRAGRTREIRMVIILMITLALELWSISMESAWKN